MECNYSKGSLVACSNNKKDWVLGRFMGINRLGEYLIAGCPASFEFITKFSIDLLSKDGGVNSNKGKS